VTQSSESSATGSVERGTDLAPALSALVEHLRALRSAWGVLAPSGLSAEKTDIAETGRTLNDELMELVHRDPSHPDLAATAEIEASLYCLESEMREIASMVPLAQLRSTLPECVSHNRRGVLDLLDLILSAEILELDGTPERIPLIDYLITLLCSARSGQPLIDPVQLTPRLHELCERAGGDYDPRLPEIEAEFFHAADMYEADARGEQQLLALQIRKAELGVGYFAPQVLRAIVTYNAALLQRIDEEVLASQDWGSLPPVAIEAQHAVSVFDTTALPPIAQALRRRVAGKAPEMNATDRIAWCLDLDYPSADERRALLAEPAGSPDDLAGAVVLVGLLCRSSIVLEDEFPGIGTTAAQLFDEWVPELSDALQQKVNLEISGSNYREACMLSELKSRFLYASVAELRRQSRLHAPTPAPVPVQYTPREPKTAETAKPIVEEALANVRAAASAKERPRWNDFPMRRVVAIGAAIAGVLLIFEMGQIFLWNSDHARFDRDQLNELSYHLSHGTRNEHGQGAAFVGEIRDSWSELEASEQMLVAADLIGALREQGVRDAMIYDDDGILRIQALGDQPPRVLPGIAPDR
jgi:hypothetical protein